MNLNEIVTFDLETGTKTLNKRKASFRDPENYIVASGFKIGKGETFGDYYTERTPVNFPDLTDKKLLVGQNIKFDLLWTWHEKAIQDFIKAGGTIWDTQLAEYIIEGAIPSSHMASMDSMVERYGGTLKIDAVKDLWQAGVDTKDIHKDLLMSYLLGNKDEDIEGDVNNTLLIFLGQVQRIVKMHPNTMQMVKNRMDSILCTTEMEYNGLYIDQERGNELREEVRAAVDKLDEDLVKYIPDLPEELVFNWNSIYHKSYLIYGGTARYDKWLQHRDEETDKLLYAKTKQVHYYYGEKTIPGKYYYKGFKADPYSDDFIGLTPDTYKSGKNKGNFKYDTYTSPGTLTSPYDDDFLGLQPDRYLSGKRIGEPKSKNVMVTDLSKPKGAKQDHYFTFDGYTTPDSKWKSELTDGEDKPIYSTSADVIEVLATRGIPFLTNLSKRQKLSKDLGTYYWDTDKKGNRTGMLTLVDERTGCIHHSLNHTQTVTTRMSSSNPNGQNIPRKDNSYVKQVFTSRYGDDGRISELDYSSLEVVVQAVLTEDPQLIKDLLDGVDFHIKRLAMKLGEPYDVVLARYKSGCKETATERTKIKRFTFQRAYGAGAYKVAASTGIPYDDVVAMIELEDLEYSGVQLFDDNLRLAIQHSRVETGNHLFVAGVKVPQGIGHWYSPTGTKFAWVEHETPEFLHKKGKLVGFSPTERKNYGVQGVGGEIVQTMIGVVYRWLLSQNHFDGNVKLINTVHDSIYLDIHKDYVEKVIPTVKQILEAVPRKYLKDFGLKFPVPFPVEADVGMNMYATMGYDDYIASDLNN